MTTHEAVSRYPLEWPLGWKRTRIRKYGKFRSGQRSLTMQEATVRLERELDRLGCKDVTLSTNVSLRLDGRPRGDEKPTDPGAAVYFSFKGKATVLACDTYTAVADNIAALAAHLDFLRGIERHGVGTIEQALAGYKALPADTAADWRVAFGFNAGARVSVDELTSRYRLMAKDRHPDKTHDDGAAMAWLNRARDYAMQELQG